MDEQRERKLRLAESAAASAVLNGCDPDEVRRRVNAGITEALDLNRRSADRHAATVRPAGPAPARTPDGALSRWADAVG